MLHLQHMCILEDKVYKYNLKYKHNILPHMSKEIVSSIVSLQGMVCRLLQGNLDNNSKDNLI